MDIEKRTLIEYFYDKERATPNKPFLRQPFGDRWEVYTWGEVGQRARKLATGLQSLGLAPKSHIGLVSKNCREWVIADLAIMMAGFVSVPLYPTLTGEQLAEVLDLGDVAALIVGKMEVWDNMKTGVPEGMPLITFPHYEGNSKIEEGEQWHDFLNRFDPIEGYPVPEFTDLWTIVFTSGTTGTPKGVMLTYENLHYTGLIKKVHNYNPAQVSENPDENHFFSFLPLNHIAERVVVESGCITFGGQISFAENLERFAQNLAETQPTILFAVPRIWTKFQLGVLSKMPQQKLDRMLRIPIISGLVKKRIKKGLGLSRSRANISGAAPISDSLKKWYKKIGIDIIEGYGMTENCAICCFLQAHEDKPGSVGKAQPSVELKIAEDTGEILMKANFVMKGYYKNTDKTAEVIKDGWLHTGDQGHIDEEGYLYITGRVKDTFKTSKGKFIVPAPLEWSFEGNNDVEQICVVGLGMPQPMALVVPSEIGQSKDKEALKASLCQSLEAVNSDLPNYRKLSTVVVVKETWNVENGLLTPTLKVKRGAMNQKYKEKMEAWHHTPEEVLWETD